MSARIFDGKAKAEGILEDLVRRVAKLDNQPKLVSFYNPKDSGSTLYTRIKKQKAESVGIEFVEREIEWVEDAASEIREIGERREITGVIVQHPAGEFAFSDDDWNKLVEAIPPEKDVDGLRKDSSFAPATVRAVLVAIEDAGGIWKDCKICVVGATGMVGRKVVEVLSAKGAKVRAIDETTEDIWYQTKNSDIVISAVGKQDLILGEQIKEGAIVIDVGSPGGDIHFDSASAVASFITPVPGGIGPLTVACLLENTVLAAER